MYKQEKEKLKEKLSDLVRETMWSRSFVDLMAGSDKDLKDQALDLVADYGLIVTQQKHDEPTDILKLLLDMYSFMENVEREREKWEGIAITPARVTKMHTEY